MRDKILPTSLNDLNFSKELIKNELNIDFKDLFYLYFVKGVSKHCLGFKYKLSRYFRNDNDYKKFYTALSNKLGITFLYLNQSDLLTEIKKDVFYMPNILTVIEFYESIRNSLAHRNFFYDNENNLIFFMSFSKDSSNIDKIWNIKTKFIFKCNDINILVKIGEFLFEYINNLI